MPIYEEEYNDYEQYEDYTYDDSSEEDDGDEGWARAREMLEEKVVTLRMEKVFFY